MQRLDLDGETEIGDARPVMHGDGLRQRCASVVLGQQNTDVQEVIGVTNGHTTT